MQAYFLESSDHLGRLRLGQLEPGPPAPDEALVRLAAVSLNPVDYKLIDHGNRAWTYPHIPGVDGAGTVEQVGSAVSGLQPGERVYFHTNLARPGTFAEYVRVRAIVVAPIPESVSFVSAAALPCAAWTAYQAIDRKLRLRAGETTLIQGGSGGVGGYAVQFAKFKGARVLSTCSTTNVDYVYSLGADVVIDYRREDVAARVRELTGGSGVEAVLNTVSSASATADLELLRFNGQLAFINGAPDYQRVKSFSQALSFHQVALGGAYAAGDEAAQRDLAQMGREVMALLAAGQLQDCVSEVLPFNQLEAGLARLKAGQVRGKIVCTLESL